MCTSSAQYDRAHYYNLVLVNAFHWISFARPEATPGPALGQGERGGRSRPSDAKGP